MIKNKKSIPYYFIIPALLITVLVHYFPIFWGIFLSFKKIDMKNFSKFMNAPLTISNFIDIFKQETYLLAIRNILLFVAITIPVTYIISLFIALYINRKFAFKSIIIWIILLPYITPDTVVYSMFRYMFTTYTGIVNQMLLVLRIIDKPLFWLKGASQIWPIIIATIWKSTSFGTLILLAGLENIPDYIYEASRIDGANIWYRFKYITWPLLKPVSYTLLLVSIIWNFYAFNQFYVLLGPFGPDHYAIVPTVLIRQTAFFGFNIGLASAMSTLLLIVVLIFTTIYFKVQQKQEAEIW